MILQLFFLLISPFLGIAQTFRMPAEWEKQEKVWLTWFGQIRRDSVTCRVIEALQPGIPVSINFESDSMKLKALKYLATFKIDTTKIEFLINKHADFWTRDPFLFVKDELGKLYIACFDYTLYGAFPVVGAPDVPEYVKLIATWDEWLGKHLNLAIIKSNYVFEAGGIEANGNGTFLVIREMALERNPGKTLAEIENELKRTLGAKKVIWLKDGLIEDKRFKNMGPFHKNYFGGGANMHVDELCRFVNDTTVVLPYILKDEKNKSPVDSINYEMLESNNTILQNSTTWHGKKINVIRIPMPEIEQLKFSILIDSNNYLQYKDYGFRLGDTIFRIPAASYCNYFVSNNVVLIPKYWKPGMSDTQKQKDEEVRNAFAKLFPERKVIQIYTLSINRGGGGIHCMTHEQPFSGN